MVKTIILEKNSNSEWVYKEDVGYNGLTKEILEHHIHNDEMVFLTQKSFFDEKINLAPPSANITLISKRSDQISKGEKATSEDINNAIKQFSKFDMHLPVGFLTGSYLTTFDDLNKNKMIDGFLASTDLEVIQHQDEIDAGVTPTLSVADYQTLLTERKDARSQIVQQQVTLHNIDKVFIEILSQANITNLNRFDTFVIEEYSHNGVVGIVTGSYGNVSKDRNLHQSQTDLSVTDVINKAMEDGQIFNTITNLFEIPTP